jgi:hypothetical protein
VPPYVLHKTTTYLGSVEDNRLPSRRDKLVSIRIDLVTELVFERREREELVHQARVVAFHDNAERDDEREYDCFPPEAQRLANRHVVFIVDGCAGVVGDVGRSQPFGDIALGFLEGSHID